MDARMETKEEFRNAIGFRKARALLELTFARELKATAMNGYSFRTINKETKIVCGHCRIQEEQR